MGARPIACKGGNSLPRVGAGEERTRGGDACIALIGIKLRKTPASWSCHAAWTTPTPCQLASAEPDRGADPWDTADACPPAPVLPPAAALYWETACASRSDSPSACSA